MEIKQHTCNRINAIKFFIVNFLDCKMDKILYYHNLISFINLISTSSINFYIIFVNSWIINQTARACSSQTNTNISSRSIVIQHQSTLTHIRTSKKLQQRLLYRRHHRLTKHRQKHTPQSPLPHQLQSPRRTGRNQNHPRRHLGPRFLKASRSNGCGGQRLLRKPSQRR